MEPVEPVRPSWNMGLSCQTLGCYVLTVILVAMAVAYMFPIFGKAKQFRQRSGCVDNLRQLGAALHIYADDHAGKLPDTDSWQQALPSDVRERLKCPTTLQRYILNERLAGKLLRDVANPRQVPVAWDAPDKRGRPPHMGGFNVLFLDGHYEWLAEDEFRQLRKDADKDAAVPYK